MARVSNVVLLNQHPVEQALLRYFLSSEGVASSSLSPRAGLDALAAMAPDLVIADAAGAHGCARLRERLPDARIVALAEAGEVEGAHAVLRRPLDFHRLNRDLRPLLEEGVGVAERGPAGGRGRMAVRAPFVLQPGKAPRPPHVLVVEDDRDVLEYYRAVLAGAGAVVDAIQDPSSFREALPPGGSYDLALVDLFMPGVDGIELLRRFSADVRNCASKLYVITAADDEALRALAQRSGADGYLTKPLKQKALLELLAV
jgi:DNA-binding response OmpR family regulator